jgi:hypothetical protein
MHRLFATGRRLLEWAQRRARKSRRVVSRVAEIIEQLQAIDWENHAKDGWY